LKGGFAPPALSPDYTGLRFGWVGL